MPSDDVLAYRTLLVSLGVTAGVLGMSLLYEIAPEAVAFNNGVDPTLQGAVVGGALILVMGVAATLIAVGET